MSATTTGTNWWTITARSTGTRQILQPGENELPYMVVCLDHLECVDMPSKASAREIAAWPFNFCGGCVEIWQARRASVSA